jgi:hypothetical protein
VPSSSWPQARHDATRGAILRTFTAEDLIVANGRLITKTGTRSRSGDLPAAEPDARRAGAEAPAPVHPSGPVRYAGALSKKTVQSACLLAPLPRMNSSTMSWAASSLNCTGGLFMK